MSFKQALHEANIVVDESFYEAIEHYKAHFHKWNKIHNLSGYYSDEELDYYILDSLLPLEFLPTHIKSVLDIGTGAGFPGLILAMARKDMHFTLVEPHKKRASFLQFVTADVPLNNVTVVRSKIEALPPQRFDLITSRAVSETNILLEMSKNFRDEKSYLLFYKGERVYDEIDPSLQAQIIKRAKRHYLLIKDIHA